MGIKALFSRSTLAALLLLSSSQAWPLASEFKLGIGENVRRQDGQAGGAFIPLTTALSNRSINQDFITHWFHPGWRNAFPDSGVSYLSGSCNSGSEFNNLAAYQNVLSAGKRLVLVWWWHNDVPCDTSARTDAENVLRDCLVPLIKALTPGPGLGSQVYVILQPEYNRYDACNAYQDATWSTHLNTMLAQVHSIAVPGLTVLAGPSVGDWAYDRSAYQVEGSLNGALANSDFISFHNIYRQNSDHPTPNDTHYGNASTDQIEHALSYARYLKKRFNKPVLYAYQSTNSSVYGTTAQSEALIDIFRRRASLEAADVKLFGPFWLFPDGGYAGESLLDSSGVSRPAFNSWRDESNAVIANTNRTHSIAFVAPDQGDVFSSGTVSVQWISRGRPQTASTFNLDVSVNGGAFSSVATGLAGDDASIMSYSYDACAIAPAADIRLRLTCAATGATVTSGRFSVKKLSATSNAQHTFEAGTHNWVGAGNATVTRVGAETFFHGASSGSLKVVSDFNSSQNSYIENSTPGIGVIAGTPRFTALIYVPFNLNPCIIPGATVSKVIIDMQAGSYMASPQILLQEGWNRVVHDFTGASGSVTYLKMNFNNKWGYTGNPAIYVDEIRVGNDLVFSGGACSSPTVTSTHTVVAGTPTSTQTIAVGSPTATPTISRTFTPTPTAAAVCAPEYNFDGGTTQGFAAGSAAVTGVSSTTTQPYEGSHSMQVALNLTSTNNEGLIVASGAGFPKNYTGQTLTYWLYIPAGMSNGSNPSGATLYVKTGVGFTWHESAWMNLPATAGWNQISFSMGAVANPNDVREMGVKIALGGASPNWAGTVYVDSLGGPAACPSPTPTFTSTRTTAASTDTRTATPTRTTAAFTDTRTGTPTRSSTPTFTATPSITELATSSSTRTISATSSHTQTSTNTRTQSFTATGSATRTATPTFSSTGTPTATSTESPDYTHTATPTATDYAGTPTNTPTITPSFSGTQTGTASATGTVTSMASPSETSTGTPTASSTETPGDSPTGTPTVSATPTATDFAGSPTDSPTETQVSTGTSTFTATPTDQSSQTRTATPTVTRTATTVISSATFTSTRTGTPSFTSTPTTAATAPGGGPAATQTASAATATAIAAATPGSVLRTLPSLNPQLADGRLLISVNLSGRVDSLELKLYSRAYQLIGTVQKAGPWGPGWNSVVFNMPEQANGTYFYLVRAVSAQGPSGLPKRGTFVVLK